MCAASEPGWPELTLTTAHGVLWYVLYMASCWVTRNKVASFFPSSFSPFLSFPSLLSLPSLPPFPPSFLSPPSLPPARPVANISGPGDIIITAGMTLQLQCQATGAPPPNITWSRDGMTFDPSSERVVMTGRSLEIMNVNEDDSGTYFCIAVSTAGRVAVSARYIHTSILE